MTKLPSIERPNGKVYTPRKIEARGSYIGEEGEPFSVQVFGTHDVAFARPLAEECLAAMNAETVEVYGPDCLVSVLREPPELNWVGTSPGYDGDNEVMVRYFKDDAEKGRATVVWKLDLAEYVPPVDERPDGIMPPPLDGVDL